MVTVIQGKVCECLSIAPFSHYFLRSINLNALNVLKENSGDNLNLYSSTICGYK